MLLGLLLHRDRVLPVGAAPAQQVRGPIFTNLDLLANLTPRRPAWRCHLPQISACHCGVPMARLSSSSPPPARTPRSSSRWTSRAQCARPTSRRRRSIRLFFSSIAQLPQGVRVGIVSFASEPVSTLRPTADLLAGQLKQRIDGLTARDGDGDGRRADAGPRHRREDPRPTTRRRPRTRLRPPPAAAGARPRPHSAPSVPTDQPSGQPLVAAILLSDGANSVGQTEPLDDGPVCQDARRPDYTVALGTPNGPSPSRISSARMPPSTCHLTPRP